MAIKRKKTEDSTKTKKPAEDAAIQPTPEEEGKALERRAAIKKVVLTLNDDNLAAWLVEKKHNLDKSQAEEIINSIREEIKASAAGDRKAKLGETLARLNEIYKTAIQTMDAKTALAVAKELSKTQRLYNAYEEEEETSDSEKTAARRILESVYEGDNKELTLDELAKALVYRIIKSETAKPCQVLEKSAKSKRGPAKNAPKQ